MWEILLVVVYLYCRCRFNYQEGKVWNPLTGWTPPYFCTCFKPEPGIPSPYVVVFLLFNDLRWEVVVHFVGVVIGCRYHMVVGFTTTCAISEFESHSQEGVLDVMKFVSDFRSVVFTGYSDFFHQFNWRHDITEILLKMVLSTITLTLTPISDW